VTLLCRRAISVFCESDFRFSSSSFLQQLALDLLIPFEFLLGIIELTLQLLDLLFAQCEIDAAFSAPRTSALDDDEVARTGRRRAGRDRRALVLSAGTPSPFSYSAPRLNCERAVSGGAAFSYQLAADL